jgi:uncharacterized protein (TIGR00369 family)
MGDHISEATITAIQSYIDSHPFLDWIGLKIDRLSVGNARVSVEHSDNLTNVDDPAGFHGGVSSTAVDVAGAVVLCTSFDEPESAVGQGSISTTNLTVSYFRPATDDLVVTAETVYAGEYKGVVNVIAEVVADAGTKPVVAGTASYRLFRD